MASIIYLYILATPLGLWDPSSPTRDWTRGPAVKALSPNHWMAREFPPSSILCYGKKWLLGLQPFAFCREGGRWGGRKGHFPAELAQEFTWTSHTTSLFYLIIHPQWKGKWKMLLLLLFLMWETCCLGWSRVLVLFCFCNLFIFGCVGSSLPCAGFL